MKSGLGDLRFQKVSECAQCPPRRHYAIAFGLVLVLAGLAPRVWGELPEPREPQPADGTTNSRAALELAWNYAIESMLTNGGFESGGLAGWSRSGSLVWRINDPRLLPFDGNPRPAASGRYNAQATVSGSAIGTLTRTLTLPTNATSIRLSWMARVQSYQSGSIDGPAVAQTEFAVTSRSSALSRTNFSLKTGGHLDYQWQEFSVDLTEFSGQSVTIAFTAAGGGGLAEFHLDEVRVEVNRQGNASFEIYLGSRPALGAQDLAGSASELRWKVSGLAPASQYYWQVVVKDGAEARAGPVWSFVIAPIGPLHHFSVDIPDPALAAEVPFRVAITARDAYENVVSEAAGDVRLAGLAQAGRVPKLVISELLSGRSSADSLELQNVSGAVLHLPILRVTCFDAAKWPGPAATLTLTNLTLQTNRLLTIREGFTVGDQIGLGTNLDWAIRPGGGQTIAALIQDGDSNILDFVCIGTARPAVIARPSPIPLSEWLGAPLPALTNSARSWQRMSDRDNNGAGDWALLTPTSGRAGGVDWGRHRAGPAPVIVTPDTAGGFSNGVLTASVLFGSPGSALMLAAADQDGRFGISAPVEVASLPRLVIEGPVTLSEADGTSPGAGIIRAPAPRPADLIITLTSSDPTAIQAPNRVTLPAGSSEAHFDLVVVDDSDLEGPQTVELTASADGFYPGTTRVVVEDDETAALTLQAPARLREGGAPAQCVVFASAPPKRAVEIELLSQDDSILRVPAFVVLPAGEMTATFLVTPVNNAYLDGTVRRTISAHVPKWSPGSAEIEVEDNDEPTLALGFSGPLVEGAGPAVNNGRVELGGVSRTNVLVSLASSDPATLQLPEQVEIPAGRSLAAVDITLPENTVPAGTRHVVVTMSAPGFESAQVPVSVLDNDPVRFSFQPVASPQDQHQPFDLTIEAWDVNGELLSGFGGQVELSARSAEGVVGVSPPITGAFGGGRWTGPTAVESPGLDVVLTASGGGAQGQSTPFDVLARSQLVLNLPVRDLVSDPARPRLYVTLADDAAQSRGWLAVIDPFTGAEEHRLDVGMAPDALALSADGRFLYASLPAEEAVVQVNLQSLELVRRVELRDPNYSASPAVALAVAPDQPELVALLIDAGSTVNVAVFDRGLLRPGRVSRSGSALGQSICFGERDGRLYFGSDLGYERLMIGTNGASAVSSVTTSPNYPLFQADGRLIAGDGRVLEAETGRLLGQMFGVGTGVTTFDRAEGRLFRHRYNFLEALEFDTLALNGQEQLSASPLSIRPRLERWGIDGFAFLATDGLHIIRNGRLSPPARAGDLEVHESVTPNPVLGAEGFTVHVTVANRGPTSLEDVVLAEILPEGLELVRVDGPADNCTVWGKLLLCSVPVMPPNSVLSWHLRFEAERAGEFEVAAFTTHRGSDPRPENNTATAKVIVRNGILAADISVIEGGEGEHTAEIPVRLGFPSAELVRVKFSTEWVAGFPYKLVIEATNGELEFPPGTTNQLIRVRYSGNASYHGNTPFYVRLFDPLGAALITPLVAVSLLEDDPIPDIQVTDVSQLEGRAGIQNMSFVVRLNGRTSVPARVDYFTIDDSASGRGVGADYSPVQGTLNFSPGVTNFTINVPIAGDTVNEPDEQFHLVFTNAVDAALGVTQATGTILDDDFGPGEFHHVAWDSREFARRTDEPFQLTLVAKDILDATVPDYSGRLELGAGAVEQLPSTTLLGDVVHTYANSYASPTFTFGYRLIPRRDLWLTHLRHYFGVKITLWEGGQKLIEKPVTAPPGTWSETRLDMPMLLKAGRTYTVSLYSGQGAYLGNGQYYALTWYAKHDAEFNTADIELDAKVVAVGDALPAQVDTGWEKPLVDVRYVVPAMLPGALTPTSTGPFSNGVWTGSAVLNIAGHDLFFVARDNRGAGGVSGLFTAFVRGDLLLEATASQPFLTIGQLLTNSFVITNIGPSSATGVVLTHSISPGASLVSYASSQGTSSTRDGSVIFDLGVVPAGTAATAEIILRPDVVGILTNLATLARGEADPDIANNTAILITPVYPLPDLTAADAWTEVREGGASSTNLVFQVNLSRVSSVPVTVDYSTKDETAKGDSDYTPVQGTLTFAPGVTNARVTVVVNANTASEPVERLFLVFTNAAGAALRTARAVGTIYDNNPLPVVTVVPRSVTEGDDGFIEEPVTIRLSRPTSELVYGDLFVFPGTALPVNWALPSPLEQDYNEVWGGFSFLPGQLESQVYVPIVGDRIRENSEYFTVTIGAQQGATGSSSGRITIIDNDPLPELRIADARQVEGNDNTHSAGFLLTLSAQNALPVRVTWGTASGTAESGIDFQPVSGTVTFPPGFTEQTILVPLIGDTLSEPDEQFVLKILGASGAQLVATQAVATIVDDDPAPEGLHHLAFDRILSPQTAGQPFEVRLWARDAAEQPLPQAHAAVALHAHVGPPATVGTLLGDRQSTQFWEGGNVSLGLSFTPSVPLRITHFRHYFGVAGMLWRANGTQLVRVPLVSTPGQWRETPLPQPLLLEAGERYLVTVFTGPQPYYIQQIDPPPFGHGVIHKGYTELGDTFPRVDLDRFLVFIDLRYEANWPQPVRFGPSTAIELADGFWRGLVTLPEPAPAGNVVIEATASHGVKGHSNPFAVGEAVDGDGDRMEDNWEIRHGLSPWFNNADADADGDGASNGDEFMAGTDPTDASSRLASVAVRSESDKFVLRFLSQLGRTYVPETASSLRAVEWLPIGAPIAGTGNPIEIALTAAKQGSGFYRIRVAP